VEQLLRDRSEAHDRCAALEGKAKTVDSKDHAIASLEHQLREQSEQLDALVAELGGGAGRGANALGGCEEAELRRQIAELRAANARLDAKRVDAERVFEHQLNCLRDEMRARERGQCQVYLPY